MNAAFEKRWIRINSSCRKLIAELNDWKFIRGQTDRPARNNNDGPDALKYGWEPLLAANRDKWGKVQEAEEKVKRVRKPRTTSVAFNYF